MRRLGRIRVCGVSEVNEYEQLPRPYGNMQNKKMKMLQVICILTTRVKLIRTIIGV